MSNQDHSRQREVSVDAGIDDPSFIDAGNASRWVDYEIHEGKSAPSKRRNQRRGGFRFFRFCRRMVALALLLFFLLIAAVSGAAYLYRQNIRVEVEKRLITELERQNIHLSYGASSFDLVRGLVIENAKLFEDAERNVLLAECSELGFSFNAIDFAQQAFRGSVTTAFTAQDATVIFYEQGEAVAVLEGLGATIVGSEERVVIERFRGQIGDLDFDLDGEVLIDREERRRRKQERQKEAAPNEVKPERKIANFAFFHGLMPWLALTSQDPENSRRPEIRASFVVDPTNESAVKVEGQFNGQGFVWRGIPLDSAAITFAFAEGDKRLNLTDFNLIYGGRIISGQAVWDTGTNQVEVTRFQSSADLVRLVQQASPRERDLSRLFRQSEPPLIGATGRLDLKQFFNSDLHVDYRHPGGVSLLVGEKELDLQGIHGRLHVSKGGISSDELLLGVLGGRVALSGRAEVKGGPMTFEGSVDAKGIPLQAIVDQLGGDQQLPGILSLQYEGVGGTDLGSFNGQGKVRIDSGELYQVPLIGPIQAMMNSVTPMFGDKNRGELTASFRIDDGVMSSDDLTVLSDGTKLQVDGTIDLTTWQTKFEAKGNLVGALGLVTGLVSKALVVEGSGPINDLDMSFKTVPAEFASETVKSIFGVAGQGVNLVKEGAIKATGGAIETGADAVIGVGQKTVDVGQKTVGEGAKMIGQGILKIIPGTQGRENQDRADSGDTLESDKDDDDDGEKKERRLLRGLGPVFSDG